MFSARADNMAVTCFIYELVSAIFICSMSTSVTYHFPTTNIVQ